MQLINADAVKQRLIAFKQRLIAFATELHTEVLTLDTIIMILNQYEPVDAVQVVRCKDCKYWEKQKDSAQGRCILSGNYPTSAWFCANGERKDDAK